MKIRNKYILSIIVAWIFFIMIILAASAYISISGLAQLEKKATIDSVSLVSRVMLANLERLFSVNADYAYWDDTYNFVKDKNTNYIQTNLAEDFFRSNQLNYVAVLDNSRNIVWSNAYDFSTKSLKAIPAEFTEYFQKNSRPFTRNAEDYNNLIKKQIGIAGFIMSNTNDIIYFVLNTINSTNADQPTNGFLIYGKILSADFLKSLSAETGYSIKLIPITHLSQIKNSEEILHHLTNNNNSIQIQYEDNNLISGYWLIKDIDYKPIALLEVSLPRTLYTEGINSLIKYSVILLIFALFGMFTMSALVYSFFKKQELLTVSFERFVPHELIELLEKKSILEVILGTSSKRTLSVLFMDIRNFTTITEGLSPQESFNFLNNILREVAPIVIKNHGFIDKYIGDAIMALFPDQENNADNAVAAAMMILDEMDKINYTGKLNISFHVKVGIGINTGHSILGIIGTEGRLEGTVISDAVNVASRIQSLTKTYNAPLLISEETYKSMKHPEFYQITHLEEVQVKGKTVKISLYKVEKKQ